MAGDHRGPELAPSDSAETLTILGATTRAAAQSARRAFFLPVTADLFADLDLQEVATATQIEDYPTGFERVLNGSHSGHWLYTGALENYPDLIEHWQTIRPLLGNGADVLRRVRDPLQVAGCLQRARLPCPGVCLQNNRIPRDGEWLRKPLRSAAGLHIEPWASGSSAIDENSCYYQERLHGEAVAGTFLASGGDAVLLGVTRQLLGENSFRYAGSIGPLQLSKSEKSHWITLGKVLAAEFQLVGLFGVDAIRNENGIWPVEINPRYTSSMEILEAASGQSLIGMHVTACREGKLPETLVASDGHIYGKQICFASQALKVDIDLRSQFAGIADVPQPNTQFAHGDPVMTVLRRGQSVEEVAPSLQAAIAEFHQFEKRQTSPASTALGL